MTARNLILIALPLALASVAGSADAACATRQDMAEGVLVTRADGSQALVRSSRGEVRIDFFSSDAVENFQQGPFGVYVTSLGTATVGTTQRKSYRYYETPQAPEAGTYWTTEIVEAPGSRDSRTLKASFGFGDPADAKLGDCTYTIFPAEAHFTATDFDETRRWVYFPDLGFGFPTKIIDNLTGKTEVNGIAGLEKK